MGRFCLSPQSRSEREQNILQSQFTTATKTKDTFLLQRKRLLLDLHHQESFHTIPSQHQEYCMLCSSPPRTAEFEATINETKEDTIERRKPFIDFPWGSELLPKRINARLPSHQRREEDEQRVKQDQDWMVDPGSLVPAPTRTKNEDGEQKNKEHLFLVVLGVARLLVCRCCKYE
jgi:hypothetical protein